MAVRPISKPSAAVTNTRFRCTIGRSDSPTQRINQPNTAPATPIITAHPRVANVGGTAGGTTGSASEKVPSPVQPSKPTNTSAPMPEASSPGRATRLNVIPPIPAASMIRNAPSTGDPSRVLIAAKLPADAMIVRAIGGASFFARCTANAPRPPPIAISGPSGPSTAPRLSVVSAARIMPTSSRPLGGPPPVLKPKAGEWPAVPGRYRMVDAVNSPHSTNQGTGHQAGTGPPRTCSGRPTKTYCWTTATKARKPYAMTEMGTPKTAASTSAEMYALERMTTAGSKLGGDAAGSLIPGNPARL